MGTYQIEMRWRCSACDTENLGRHKTCQHCGKPKGREEFYDAPEDEEVPITDPELLKQALAGPDWECAFCKSHQRRDSGECVECGAPNQAEARKARKDWDWEASKKAAEPRRKPPEWITEAMREALEAERDRKISERVEAVEGRGYRGYDGRIERVDVFDRELSADEVKDLYERGPHTPPPVVKEEPESVPRPPFFTRRKKIIAAASAAVMLVGVLCYFLFRTRIVDASVTAREWQYIVHVDRYQIKRDSGFDEDQPGDAFEVTPVGMRHHHYKKVRDGTKQVPYSERYACGTTPRVCTQIPKVCTQNKNGFKTCSGGGQRCTGGDTKYCTRTKYRTEPKYKDVSVEEMYYNWKVWRWVFNRSVVERGSDNEPKWPTDEKIALNENLHAEAKKERERRETKFSVTFTDEDKETHSYTPKGLEEFRTLPMGKEHRLRVGIARGTEIVKEGE
jgi:hypothetical protein